MLLAIEAHELAIHTWMLLAIEVYDLHTWMLLAIEAYDLLAIHTWVVPAMDAPS